MYTLHPKIISVLSYFFCINYPFDDDMADVVNTILVSTRGSTEPNPLKKLYSDSQPPTKQELENYLHLHPAIKEVEEVQDILQVHYCQYESEEEDSSDEEIVT